MARGAVHCILLVLETCQD